MKTTLNAPPAKPTKAPTYPRLVEAIQGTAGFTGGVFLLLHDRAGALGAPERFNAIRLRDGSMITITPAWYQDYKGSVTIEND